MRRPSPWLLLVVILLGAFILREPRLLQLDDVFLDWFLEHSEQVLPPAQVTLVEIGRDDIERLTPPEESKPLPKGEAARRTLSPLEYALFLQAVLEFQPRVVGIEPILIWRDRDKIQEQVFLDQAMRVPKLLVGLELGGKGKRDLAPDDLGMMPNVSGDRGNLPQFAGVSQAPDDDVRLISTPGLINLPNEESDPIQVPMLFEYRGEIVPSFPLQAIMLWLRATPADLKVELGRRIDLPNGWQIPLHRDGSTTINLAARQSVPRLTLNELLLAAQEHERHQPLSRKIENLKDQIVLLRIADDPLQGPNIFSAAIATIQSNSYVHRAPSTLAWIIIFAGALLASFLWMISKTNLVLGAIVLTAGYAMVELASLARDRLWLPAFLPLTLLWFLVIVRLFGRDPGRKDAPGTTG
ncbi:MAG: CHASE2 domain-containing protein [Chthoniobacterales bacterium]